MTDSTDTNVTPEPQEPEQGDPTQTPPANTQPKSPIRQEDIEQLVRSRVEEARSQEKQKLYSKLQKAEEREAKYNELLEQHQDLQKQLDELKNNTTKKTKGDPDQMEASVRRMMEKTQKSFEEQLNAVNEKLLKAEKDAEQARIDAYREKRIAEIMGSGGDLIPELVSGSTQAEIDESIVKSQQTYARIMESATNVGPPAARNTLAPPTPAGKSATEGNSSPGTLTIEQRRAAFARKTEEYRRSDPQKLRSPEFRKEMLELFPQGR